MKNKVIIVFASIFVLNFISSCCPNEETIEITYSDIDSKLFTEVNSNFVDIEQNTAVEKLDFLMGLYLEEDQKRIASNFKQLQNLSFQKSYAISCPGNSYIYLESINDIKIKQIDANGNKVDVTLNFKAKNFNNEFVDIKNYLSTVENEEIDLFFYLRDEKNIENDVNFEIEISFTSNKVLNHKTDKILFN